MKPSIVGSLMLAVSASLTSAISLPNFHLLSSAPHSKAYCLSPHQTETSNTLSISQAASLCASIPSTFTLAPANITTNECSCKSWHVGALNTVACNCDSCAIIEIKDFDRTCAKLAEGCLTGEEAYHGGYMEKFGGGMRGYLAVRVEGGFERSELSVACAREKSESTKEAAENEVGNSQLTVPLEMEEAIEIPDLWRDIPVEIVEVVEEIVYLDKIVAVNSTHGTNTSDLPSTQTDIDTDIDEVEMPKAQDDRESVRTPGMENYKFHKGKGKKGEKEIAENAALDEEKRKKQTAKDVEDAAKKLQKEKTNKYGYLDGLTDEEWDKQIKEDKRLGTYPKPFLWELNRLGYKVACKMGSRHACVWVARWDPDPRH